MTVENAQSETTCTMPVAGTEHHRLNPFEGKFRAEVKMWMGPGDPMVSTGTMTNSWELGGLYLQQEYNGDSNGGAFPEFTGIGFWGYNTTSNRYEGFWIDNGSTTMQVEYGQVDASSKVWEMLSDMICPQSGQPYKKRSLITLIDNDHNKIEMFFTGSDGVETKCMEIAYTRVA